ncbi:hypothetical protein V5O48_001895 [Marasmius crinis-equi]|uniref:Cell wall galactomannoprotein n=1 Tax=Marasmius crinis-equi TaxID=585013 RepID=A0ABR3FX54_9AGAR
MVRIGTTVVGVLAALATAALANPTGIQCTADKVYDDVVGIHQNHVSRLDAAVNGLGTSPDQVTDMQIQDLENATEGLQKAMSNLDGDVECTPSVSTDDAKKIFGELKNTNPLLLDALHGIATKNTVFTGKYAFVRKMLPAALSNFEKAYSTSANGLLAKCSDPGVKRDGQEMVLGVIAAFKAAEQAYN